MAINWEIQITNVNVESQRANVTAIRTDTESALEPQRYTYFMTPIGTPGDRVKLLSSIKADVEAAAAHVAQVDAVITDLEQAGKSNLEAWEATR
jgi:hypothetical protein